MPTKQINAENGTEPDKRNTVDGAEQSDNAAFLLLYGGEIVGDAPSERTDEHRVGSECNTLPITHY